MDVYAKIEQRYGFAVPEIYRILQTRGHLSLPWENYLAFDDCEWLKPEDIASYKFNTWEIASDGGFVPFAITGRNEPYCWRLDWAAGGEPPVVLCERSESAICLAPNLSGLLYRMTLEAFAGRNSFADTGKVEELRRAVDLLTPLLPATWAQRLGKLKNGSWKKDDDRGILFVLPQSECDAIIAAELGFPHLNESFIHDKEYLERLKSQS